VLFKNIDSKGVDFMHFRKGVLSTALSLALLMPSFAYAGTSSTVLQNGNNFGNFNKTIGSRIQVEQNLQSPKPELAPETKTKIQELITKLKNEEITNDQFREELKKIMPENHEFKHREKEFHKELSDETKAKLEELKVKLKNGEITKDQFKEELKQIIPQNVKSDKQ